MKDIGMPKLSDGCKTTAEEI